MSKLMRGAVVTSVHNPAGLWVAIITLILLSGCDVDSFMDPSMVGRWENTPVVLPILDRLDVIDEPVEEIPGLSEIRSEDLIPEVKPYVLGSGDLITITIYELITPGAESVQTRRIDELGDIRLPVIGQIQARGLTTKQLEQRIVDILDPAILRDPMVSVILQEGRQRTFSVIGGGGTGTFSIVQNNFRLLDAVALARGIPSGVGTIYVIRQVPLMDIVERGTDAQERQPGAHEPPLRKTREADDSQATDGDGEGEPPMLDPGELIRSLTEGLEQDPPAPQQPEPPAPDNDNDGAGPLDVAPPLADILDQTTAQDEGRYINVDGKWVWVGGAQAQPGAPPQPEVADSRPDGATGLEALAEPGALPPPEQLITQRVIEVDTAALMRGEARYNIVIRSDDIIRIPDLQAGNVYIGGSIGRPGTYGLPIDQKLTLKQLIISAGGLNAVAIPERVDLTRRLDNSHEATVRLNLRAIFEGVQPDIYLKPSDTINVGTNLWASHAAVIRNAFRFSYGFGFLLDRNWGQDVFGVEPRAFGN